MYDYRCSKCEHQFTKFVKISTRDVPCGEECPECGEIGGVIQVILSAPPLSDPWRSGRKKPPDGFNEVLRTIKKSNPGSTINIRD